MTETSAKLPYAVATVLGTILWTLTAALGDRTEPWDAPGYWSIAYPLAIALAGLLGYVFPRRAWRWAVVLIFVQAAVMILGGAGFGMLPLGLLLLGVLSLPAVAAASFGERLGASRAHA